MLKTNRWMILAFVAALGGAACSSSDSAAPGGSAGSAGSAGSGGTAGTDAGTDAADDTATDDAADDTATGDAADDTTTGDAGDDAALGPCDICLNANCSTEYTACSSDTECMAGMEEFQQCMGSADGGDQSACAGAAATNHPTAATGINDLLTCISTNCATDCQ